MSQRKSPTEFAPGSQALSQELASDKRWDAATPSVNNVGSPVRTPRNVRHPPVFQCSVSNADLLLCAGPLCKTADAPTRGTQSLPPWRLLPHGKPLTARVNSRESEDSSPRESHLSRPGGSKGKAT